MRSVLKIRVLLVIFLAGACFLVSSESRAQARYKKRVGVISLFPYSPVAISSLNDLPPGIVDKATAHLIDRLGRPFYERLRFTYGVKVNFDDLYRVSPQARNYEWKIFSYELQFAFSLPEAGISSYEADLWLDEKGAVLKEIDLPAIGQQSQKSTIVSAKDAIRIGKKRGFHASMVELAYRKEEDSIVWRLKRRSADGYTEWLDISAHTGEVLNFVGYKGISD
jgi:hypothetical protein